MSEQADADEAISVLYIAQQMPELVRVMKKIGLSKDDAKAGFIRMVDSLWEDPAPPAAAQGDEG